VGGLVIPVFANEIGHFRSRTLASARDPDLGFPGHLREDTMLERAVAAGAILASFAIAPASADFKVCNKSDERASVSIGYNSPEYGWTSEGWWRVPIGECVGIINGELANRYYYIYATGHRGGTWSGRKDQDGGFFCVAKEKYTHHNREYQSGTKINCERRGLQTKQFRLVDTEEANDFTYNLTE
jgi:uncharacterized membrane protein